DVCSSDLKATRSSGFAVSRDHVTAPTFYDEGQFRIPVVVAIDRQRGHFLFHGLLLAGRQPGTQHQQRKLGPCTAQDSEPHAMSSIRASGSCSGNSCSQSGVPVSNTVSGTLMAQSPKGCPCSSARSAKRSRTWECSRKRPDVLSARIR